LADGPQVDQIEPHIPVAAGRGSGPITDIQALSYSRRKTGHPVTEWRELVLNTSRIVKVALGGAVVLIAATSANNAAIPASDPVARLAGRWTGDAIMTSLSGAPETFKCVVTYLPTSDGAGMKQNLRCKGESMNLEAATLLQIEGKKVTGRWEDKINSLAGIVQGDVTKDGFEVMLGGAFFQAKMAVAGSECAQKVVVSPRQSSYFRDLSAALRKC
jgi:hypothetical protein